MNDNLEQDESNFSGIGVLVLILLFGIIWMFAHPEDVNKSYQQRWDEQERVNR